MKFMRSSVCSFKFATGYKINELRTIITEYGRICNIFIGYFWEHGVPHKSELIKNVLCIPEDTWLSERLKKAAARESIDLIKSTKERWKNKPSKIKMPIHKCKRICVPGTIANLNMSKESKHFDAWLHIASVGEKHIFDLPINFHKHFNKMMILGKKLNSYIISEKCVQFSFEIETMPKKEPINCFGIDTGINAALNILERFLTGIYGFCSKPQSLGVTQV